MSEFKKLEDGIWEIPKEGNMKVLGKIFATEKLLSEIEQGALQQLKNVAELPGIQKAALGMPDMHWGYGFPIGGVAAFDLQEGVVSPGGVGFDINCGVRLIKTNLSEKEARPKLKELIDECFKTIPAGVGGKAKIRLSNSDLKEVLELGAKWAVEKGFGWKEDLERIEEQGSMKNARAERVSLKAMQRGLPQCGTLGSGNHFIEIQKVSEVFDKEVGEVFGLSEGQIVVMEHSGSRGLGHQVATDYLDETIKAMQKYKIEVPDRQLACAPIQSIEGQHYLQAMWSAVNYSFANRQLMMHWIREGFAKFFGKSAEELEMHLLYDIAHNIAKIEEHKIEGKKVKVLVHRKGATRAFPAGHSENPKIYKSTGHPAIIPGSMGTASFVMVGTEKGLQESFGSVCHGAGRRLSRHAALREKRGEQVKKELEEKGEVVRAKFLRGLAEEMPEAYKDIDEVIKSVEIAGIGKKIAKLVPLAVMKG